MVVDLRWSQEEILNLPERWRLRNFGKRYRVKRSETSTFLSTIDSMLLGRTSSPSGINEETMAVGSLVSSPPRWTLRITSRAARSLSVSAGLGRKLHRSISSSPKRGLVPERRCQCFQSFRLLPQEFHSPGVRLATWNQW